MLVLRRWLNRLGVRYQCQPGHFDQQIGARLDRIASAVDDVRADSRQLAEVQLDSLYGRRDLLRWLTLVVTLIGFAFVAVSLVVGVDTQTKGNQNLVQASGLQTQAAEAVSLSLAAASAGDSRDANQQLNNAQALDNQADISENEVFKTQTFTTTTLVVEAALFGALVSLFVNLIMRFLEKSDARRTLRASTGDPN